MTIYTKTTAFVTSFILCLLSTSLAKAENTGFIIPATAYSITSEAGTFTDIADNPNTVKFGADLTANTALLNGFFVNDNETPFVTHVADATKTDPGFPLGFTFNFCGNEMTHFTICASGGIFFGADANIKQGQSQSWHGWYTWTNVDLQNIITVMTKDAAKNINTAQSVAGKSPVMYLIEGEAGAKVLTVQYDYAINGDEWIYQLKVYENGNVELVVGSLATANAGSDTRLFLGLVENGNYTVSNDAFTELNVQDNHFLGMTQTEAASWNTVAAYTGTSTTPDGLYVTAGNAPESGRTLTFNAPADCAEKAQKFEDAWYGFNTTKITKTSFTGNISFNTNSITPAQMTAAGTLVAVLSTSETPDYTLANGTWYKAGNKLGDNRVLINAKPRYSIDASGFSSMYTMSLSASGLTEATTYYIHIYAMDYRCTGAPVYSELCRTFSFQTSIDLPKTLSAGLPTTSSVPVTVQPADRDGFGVVLFKSPNTNALKLSGNLTPGQKIGDAEVLTVITARTATVYDVPFEAGEGAYILAYSVINPDAESPAYGQDFLSVPVRAAYDNLPVNLGFENESLSKDLPFGWSRETAWPTDQNSSPFRLSYVADDDRSICLKSTYPAASIGWTDWADVVTAAFAMPTGKTRISVTFFLSFTQNKGLGAPTQYKPTATDLMRIEYSVNGGDWEEALNINGHDDDFPQINTDRQYPLNVTINGLQAGSIIRLRYSCKSPTAGDGGTINTFIHAVAITEGKTCNRPIALQSIDSLTTDARLTFHWLDFDNLPVASTSLLAYQEVEGNGAWRGVRVATPANTTNETPIEGSLSGLKAGTAYYVKVAVLCGRNDTSFYTEPLTVRTAQELPYNETMAKIGDKTPFDRGVKTYSGIIGGQLTETTELQNGWNQNVTSNKFGLANTVSVGDFVTNAWLMLPAIFIRETGDFTPKSLNFTLSSFDADKNKGAEPNYPASTKLHIVVSDNGLFTQESIIKTLDADSLACTDRAFTVDLTEWEGYLQVAFVFECPDGVQTATENNDDEERPDPWYLEISQLRIKYDVDVCFPIKNLSRSLGINEVPLTWEPSSSAVEYGIFWGLYSASGYTDSAYTTEAHYTLTGLKDQTRYKAIVVAYCDEDRSLAADPVRTTFYTLIGCHMPENFQVSDILNTGADFISTSDQSGSGGYLTHRLVYLTPDNGGETLVFIQNADTLRLRDTLLEATTYTATTQALCEEAYSPMSQAIRFTTLGDTTGPGGDTSAVEPVAQLNGLFSVRTQDGRVVIRNLNQLLVRNVSVFNLSGIKLADFRVDSRDDLYLPVNARQLLIFVRLQTERGTVVYKVYLP